MIPEIWENDDSLQENEITVHQDGVPPHLDVRVTQFMNEHFSMQWIGRRSRVEWPAISPDLTPLDFLLR